MSMEQGASDVTEARDAAQGLLDITKSREGQSGRLTEQLRASTSGREHSPAPHSASPRLAVATVTSSGPSRLVTSGADPIAARASQEASGQVGQGEGGRKKGEFRQPAPRRPEQRDSRVVIVQRAAQPQDSQPDTGKADPAAVTCDVPVPASAFAPLIGSGDSGKSSADFTPFATTAVAVVKEDSGSDRETESETEDERPPIKVDEDSKRPLKKRRMTRTVSINTVLQRVGSKEAPLADVLGTAPQTVQEIIPHLTNSKGKGKADAPVDTLEIVEKLWGKGVAQPKGPSLPPRKSSDQSTLEAQNHIAQTEIGDLDAALKRGGKGIQRALSMERALHLPPKPPTPAAAITAKGVVVETGATASQLQNSLAAAAAAKESAEEAPKTALWTGKIKHRLKTADAASVVELFELSALVLEKLLEQMPPTIFVSALAGRANVKLGKHYVTQCRLGALTERQQQKVAALAAMKLVAICELQHCTLTLVPFTDTHQELRIVGFMIADE